MTTLQPTRRRADDSAPPAQDGKVLRLAAGRRTRATAGADAEAIYRRILNAIIEHRLAPGRKLVEERLAAVFGASRAMIRQVLTRLSHEMVVTLVPNRGAFVAEPTVGEAREVFEARRLIEPALARKLAQSVTPAQLSRLRGLVAEEERARAMRDRQTVVKLSGEFHLEIAEMAGNAILARQMRELTLLTCLIIILYDSPAGRACPDDEHRRLLEAFARHDEECAAALMLHHLDHVEQSLDISLAAQDDDDLERIFS
ncbi:GntR family transcriptional regulator [Thauera sinica]|uniref:GntR family transcriptional regulator n=1 Tax=Thauera sinica TaxID=2665146 RepID=A0ABW1AXX4_9RHOO|nr:GntR family transcriptional regulator [Thauera sp. K11]ATE58637.1 GntR family transcriptional regulator [Thauera sp. K11]